MYREIMLRESDSCRGRTAAESENPNYQPETEPDAPPVLETSDPDATVSFNREEIKAELKKLGVEFQDKARTSTLLELLDKARSAPAEEPKAEEPVKEELPPITIEDCRKLLGKISNEVLRDGGAKAFQMLAEHCEGATGLLQIKDKQPLIDALYHACEDFLYQQAKAA